MRAALFHRDHVEIHMCGVRYAIFQLFASRQNIILPHLEELRDYLRSCFVVSPAGREAMHLVKLLPTVLLNSSVERATQVLERHGFNPGPQLVSLLRRVASAKFGFVRACEDANFQRTHSRICEGNHAYYLLEGIEAAFMRAFVRALLLRAKPASVVFIHDGLLISPEPSSADIDACLREASLALGFVPPPVFRVRAARLIHDCSLRQRGTSNHVAVQDHVAQLPHGPKVRRLAPVAPTAETLHAFWSRRSGP